MSLDNIRVSDQAREQLIRLKRHTGISQWNILCRWAFCTSLADATPPANVRIVTDSPIEMTWKVFGGQYQEVYLALLKQRCKDDGLDTDEEALAQQLRLHLHRGIGTLAGSRSLRSISDLTVRGLRDLDMEASDDRSPPPQDGDSSNRLVTAAETSP